MEIVRSSAMGADLLPQIPENFTPESYESHLFNIEAAHKSISIQDIQKSDSLEKYLGGFEDTPDPGLEYLLRLLECCRRLGLNHEQGSLILPLDGLLWTKISQYMGVFDPIAVRHAKSGWRELVELLYYSANHYKMHAASLGPIKSALQRIDPSGGTLTSLHLLFVRNVLKAEIYEAALPIIDKPIHSFPSQSSHQFDGDMQYSYYQDSSAFISINSGLTRKLDEKQIQEYYLLCAMVCLGIGRRKYDDALLYLEMVLITPASNAASIFMLEAYRKWVLLYCLTKGRDPTGAPKTINGTAIRTIRTAAKPYDALVAAFAKSIQTNNRSFIQDEVEAGLSFWDDDGNLGLVKAVAECVPLFFILRLPRVFTSIPIRTIASYELLFNSPEDVTQLVQQLIDDGELKATLFNAPRTNEPSLRFNDTSTSIRSEAELFQTITQEVTKTKMLTEFVRLADAKIVMSKDHVSYMRRSREEQNKPGLALSLAGSRFNGFGDSPMGGEDEDNSMMVDDSELLGEEDDEEEDLMEP